MKNKYRIRFRVSGETTVDAESVTAAVDRVMEHFRDSGANQLHCETVEVNGEKVKQERKEVCDESRYNG